MGHEPASKTVAVIVAHPDDETLWAGGTILSQPTWNWFITTLCRASDRDRAPKFFQALEVLGARGTMGDLDDGPDQEPLAENVVQETILQLLPQTHFDLILSHSPAGEYTRHRRHEEIGNGVITLWQAGALSTEELWIFAYDDRRKQHLPRAIQTASIYYNIPEPIWQKKYSIITSIYGFEKNGFEAETTPRMEAFWKFTNPLDAKQWLENKGFHHEGSAAI